MANLYEINQLILSCIDFETGEVINPDLLDALQMERSQKIENVTLWIKNLQSDALAYKAEKDAFAEREKAALEKAEQLKKWLAHILQGEKFSTSKCAISFRRSESVEVLDESAIPEELMAITVTTKPDKNAIKELLKQGKEVSGCVLVERLNTQIK